MSDNWNAAALQSYIGRYDLMPLTGPDELHNGKRGGKQPAHSKWRIAAPLSFDEADVHMAEGRNVGVRLRATDLVLDVDPRNGGDASVVRLAAAVGVDFDDWPSVITGSGGRHIYMTKAPDVQISGKLVGYDGIDIKTEGGFVVAAGSVHATGSAYKWDDDPLALPLSAVGPAPQALLDLLKRSTVVGATDVGALETEDLADILGALDVTSFRDEQAWREVMMASHHATGGLGLDAFLDWSTSDPPYANSAEDIRKRWNSLGRANGAITEKSLFKLVIAAGHGEIINRITAKRDFEAVDDASEPPIEQIGRGNLSEKFVWVAEAEVFVRRSDTKRFSAQQFKSLHAGAWKEGDILNAIWRDKLPLRKFESMVYLPWESEVVSNGHSGRSYNIWRDSGIAPTPGDVTVFLEHMAYMFPDEAERELAIDYLALLVRRPAVKVNFAMLVKSRQGTGKSWLGSLIARIIGEPNVTRPSNTAVVEKYTDWQLGAQLAIIEELMAMGRMEVANRLKPAITDHYLSIRPMYGRVYTVPNRLNFLCFTNHDDALPLESGDRRWLVFFSEAARESEAYYERLFAFLKGDGPAHVAHWLSQRHVKLNPMGTAPKTRGKEEMLNLSMGDAEQHLSDLLAEGAAPFDFGLVRLDEVLAAVPDRIARQARNLGNRVRKCWLKRPGRRSWGGILRADDPRYSSGRSTTTRRGSRWGLRPATTHITSDTQSHDLIQQVDSRQVDKHYSSVSQTYPP